MNINIIMNIFALACTLIVIGLIVFIFIKLNLIINQLKSLEILIGKLTEGIKKLSNQQAIKDEINIIKKTVLSPSDVNQGIMTRLTKKTQSHVSNIIGRDLSKIEENVLNKIIDGLLRNDKSGQIDEYNFVREAAEQFLDELQFEVQPQSDQEKSPLISDISVGELCDIVIGKINRGLRKNNRELSDQQKDEVVVLVKKYHQQQPNLTIFELVGKISKEVLSLRKKY